MYRAHSLWRAQSAYPPSPLQGGRDGQRSHRVALVQHLEPKWCIISIHILTTKIPKFYEHYVTNPNMGLNLDFTELPKHYDS